MRLGKAEIERRFGFHDVTLEGPAPTGPRHVDIRQNFVILAEMLDQVLPAGRCKNIAMKALEDASMWAHKSVAQDSPVVRNKNGQAVPE